MNVTLDGEKIAVDRPTLAGALAAGLAEAGRRGRMIVGVEADGRPLTDAQLRNPPDGPGGPGEVRLTSADPVELVRGSMAQAAAVLAEVEHEQGESADMLARDETGGALERIARVIPAWQSVIDVLSKGLAILRIPAAEVRISDHDHPGRGPVGLDEIIGALYRHLESMQAALGNQDWSGLADVLSGELRDDAARIAQVLRSLDAQLEGYQIPEDEDTPPESPDTPEPPASRP